MAITVFTNPPQSTINVDSLVNAAKTLYQNGRPGGTLIQENYEEDNHEKCLYNAAAGIVSYAEQIAGGRIPNRHGAIVGNMANGNYVLHVTDTRSGKGNCSLFCEFVPGATPYLIVHGIGAHSRHYYRLDGVSSDFHTVLAANQAANRDCRYTDDTYDALTL